ncbi:hypothetical protein Goe2_c01400 [Bacillus phage vB_BsuM-Goe2]|uniref:Uncharacterized protein n=2 Tax=Bacillus phage vB_BsuM-Goe2 TaxID=1933062 RepID=A0A217EQF5_9CAUD|nr:hypothetical protein Goe2_c01400 [Bacillus phage vB_BsuM-Goe2]
MMMDKQVEEVKKHYPIVEDWSVIVARKEDDCMTVTDAVPFILGGYKHVSYEMDDVVVLCSDPIGLTWEDVRFLKNHKGSVSCEEIGYEDKVMVYHVDLG